MLSKNIFEMRGTLQLVLLISIVFGSSIAIFSCKKVDKTYVNYVGNKNIFEGTTLEYLKSQAGVYDSILLALERVDASEYNDTSKFSSTYQNFLSDSVGTLFAPTNVNFTIALNNINKARSDSFPQMPPVSINTLRIGLLDSILAKYLISSFKPTDSITGFSDGDQFPTYRYFYPMHMQLFYTNASGFLGGGPAKIIFSDQRTSLIRTNWVRVNTITVDVLTNNGLVHILEPGHDFGFGVDFIRRANKR